MKTKLRAIITKLRGIEDDLIDLLADVPTDEPKNVHNWGVIGEALLPSHSPEPDVVAEPAASPVIVEADIPIGEIVNPDVTTTTLDESDAAIVPEETQPDPIPDEVVAIPAPPEEFDIKKERVRVRKLEDEVATTIARRGIPSVAVQSRMAEEQDRAMKDKVDRIDDVSSDGQPKPPKAAPKAAKKAIDLG